MLKVAPAMSTHVPLTGSAASQRFHWYEYVIGNEPPQVPTLAERKWPTVGTPSPAGKLIVG